MGVEPVDKVLKINAPVLRKSHLSLSAFPEIRAEGCSEKCGLLSEEMLVYVKGRL